MTLLNAFSKSMKPSVVDKIGTQLTILIIMNIIAIVVNLLSTIFIVFMFNTLSYPWLAKVFLKTTISR
jgi:stage III sporulation protein SpoIIIAA